jgi:type VII secretion ATPase EccA
MKKDISEFDPILKDVARFLVEEQVGNTSRLQRKFSIGYNRACVIMEQLEQLGIVGESQGSKPREILVLSTVDLEEIFSEIAGAQSNSEYRTPEDEIIMDSQNELQSLIGLSSVKAEVERLTNFIKIMKIRKKQGLPVSEISYHCVFTGNPGTGKTTVARILANIYSELGVIKKGHLVETDRSGLVAEYVGQTAVKTNKIVDSAIDGILFIDEAYSLVNSGNNDYGTEAISTLLKRMEDDRNRLVVILAGYGNEMQAFINSNPGLQSRFNRYIDFPDYNADELLEIYKGNLKKHKYTLSAEAEVFISTYIANVVGNKDKNFGNARFVRNLFEKTLENQAMRLSSIGHITSEMLCEIRIEDIKSLEY